MTKTLAMLALPLALVGCAALPPAVPSAPQATTGYPEGTAVGLGMAVKVGDVLVTPIQVVEDSRCPAKVQCVWAGRLVVRTQIDGAGWRDSADLRLGESFGTHGKVVALASAEPGKVAERAIRPEDYRFTYTAG